MDKPKQITKTKYDNFFYQQYLYFHDRFVAWKKKRNLKQAIRLAIENNRGDKRTYYVLPDAKGQYRAFNNDDIQTLKRFKILSKQVNVYHLCREAAFIATSNPQIKKLIKDKSKER